MTKKTSKQQPLPGAIDGQEWKIKKSRSARIAWTDFNSKTMMVSTDDDALARAIRQHELVHVAITPRDDPRFMEHDAAVINHCEDWRVAQYMSNIGFSMADAQEVITEKELTEMCESGDLMHYASMYVAMEGMYEARTRLKRAANGSEHYRKFAEVNDWINSILGMMREGLGGKLPTFDHTVELATLIEEQYGEDDDEDDEDGEGAEGKGIKPIPEGEGEEGTGKKFSDKFPTIGKSVPEWMKMEVTKPALTERHENKLPGKPRTRPSDRGRTLRNVGRLYVDQRVFGERKVDRLGGGAIVIDCSGSMHMSAERIRSIMQKLPAATIALYAGNQYDGELRVIAKDGRSVNLDNDENLTFDWGANGVDGPALRWLNAQKGPRYWVCDGHVTGVHDATHPMLTAECDKLCRQGRITRYSSMNALQDALDKKEV